VIEEATQPTREEILDREGGRSGGSSPQDAVAAMRDDVIVAGARPSRRWPMTGPGRGPGRDRYMARRLTVPELADWRSHRAATADEQAPSTRRPLAPDDLAALQARGPNRTAAAHPLMELRDNSHLRGRLRSTRRGMSATLITGDQKTRKRPRPTLPHRGVPARLMGYARETFPFQS